MNIMCEHDDFVIAVQGDRHALQVVFWSYLELCKTAKIGVFVSKISKRKRVVICMIICENMK